jgi:hypothetical protein
LVPPILAEDAGCTVRQALNMKLPGSTYFITLYLRPQAARAKVSLRIKERKRGKGVIFSHMRFVAFPSRSIDINS